MKDLPSKLKKNLAGRFLELLILGVIMAGIGSFTAYASANTFEVIARKDIPFSTVIKGVSLTDSAQLKDALPVQLANHYEVGSFGIPKKIKLPETSRHYELVKAIYEDGQWKASTGIGHTFLTANPRQKMFGEAVIYMRVNTATTLNLGDVYAGDIVNIVTTEGWQLGFQVTRVGTDLGDVYPTGQTAASDIAVVLIDENTGRTKSFTAVLAKVGERI